MGSGFRTFATSEVLTSSNVQNFLMDQAVMSFADDAARDAAITTPVEGMVAVLRDTNVTTIYSGSAWIQFVQYGVGIAYTPVLTGATTDPSRGTGAFPEATGVYSQNGRIVTGYARLAAGNTSVTAGSGAYRISLPVTCRMGIFTNRGVVIGSGYYNDASAPTVNYVATAVATDAGDYAILRTVGGVIGSALPGLAANDFIQINFTYEAA